MQDGDPLAGSTEHDAADYALGAPVVHNMNGAPPAAGAWGMDIPNLSDMRGILRDSNHQQPSKEDERVRFYGSAEHIGSLNLI